MLPTNKTLVQCDFDGTITTEDIGFQMLDTFARGDWRRLLAQYQAGQISVGRFNTKAFAMVKEPKKTLDRFALKTATARAGFEQLLECCRQKGFRFVIVSNGMTFYIKTILKGLGLDDIEIFAANARFDSGGIITSYVGPGGTELADGFKEAYSQHFLKNGYRIVYVGNGASDALPARLADHIFATGQLLTHCQEANFKCTPFSDLNDVARGIKLLA